MQADAQDLSRSLHMFTHLAYEPRRLLGALEDGLPHTARLLSRDMHTSAKVLMCIATFNSERPRLHAWAMQELSHMDASRFSWSIMHQVIQAHMLAEAGGCGPRSRCCVGVCCKDKASKAGSTAGKNQGNRTPTQPATRRTYQHTQAPSRHTHNHTRTPCVGVSCCCACGWCAGGPVGSCAEAEWSCRMESQRVPSFVTDSKEEVVAAAINIERSWNRSLLASVQAKLDEAGYGPARSGATVSEGVLHIDLLLEALLWEGKPVALELLDACQVASNTGQPLGRWLLRRRLLEAFGFHIVTIAEDAWLATSSPTELLHSLLRDCRKLPHAVREHRPRNQSTTIEKVYYNEVHNDPGRIMSVLDE